MLSISRLLTFIIALVISSVNFANCTILTSKGKPAAIMHDPLGRLLQSNQTCPLNVFSLHDLFRASNLTFSTAMVANRGRHQPEQGSFSLFEMITGDNINKGDFFIGHFTMINAEGMLTLDQTPDKGSLMIEAFAWDAQKGFYNFYELRGDGQKGQWFYRGDTADIFADNTLLHRQPSSEHEEFGDRLRCSGCHQAGGPIMKELEAPQNDWWEPNRKLNFGQHQPDTLLKAMMATLVPAEELAKQVRIGREHLNTSTRFQQQMRAITFQEQLRPLFCPMELNLQSDKLPNEEQLTNIEIPVGFFIDPRLSTPGSNLRIIMKRKDYETTLNIVDSHFPESDRTDADHAWLTPVKAESDIRAIQTLLSNHLIKRKFIYDILDIDMTNPQFSMSRCKLLKFVPIQYSQNWQAEFIRNLTLSNDQAAKQLINNMENITQTPKWYQRKADNYLKHCVDNIKRPDFALSLYQLLSQRRAEIRASEISKNPRGQILEPGFRLIFPEDNLKSQPGNLSLDDKCNIKDTNANPS